MSSGRKHEHILHVPHVDFPDKISPFDGDYTTLNVTKPVIRVELTAEKVYRITASFTLEVDLIDFDEESQKFNKFFDSVSLRYLFKSPENHVFTPESDSWARAKLTTEKAKERGAALGASGTAPAISPNVELHFQSNKSVTVERDDMESWRRGVSQEPYLASKDYSTQSICARISRALVPQPRRLYFFRVRPPNHYREHHLSRHCRWVRWPHMYNGAVHWFWQTQWDTHMWVPEVYQSFKMPVTITREVPRDDLYKIVVEDHNLFEKQLRYLHFDFEVEARVRELGWGSNIFTRAGKPPDTRAKHDSGQPLGSDMSAFCLYCTFSDFDIWPTKETQDWEKAATAWVKEEMESGGPPPKKLPSSKEMEKSLSKSRYRTKKDVRGSRYCDSDVRPSLWDEENECYIMPGPPRHEAQPTYIPCAYPHPLCPRCSRLKMSDRGDYGKGFVGRRSEAGRLQEQEWEKFKRENIERERAEQEHKRKVEQESLEAFVNSRAERHSREGTRPSHDEVILEDALCNAEYRRWWSERRLREEILDLKSQLQEAERGRRETEVERLNRELLEAESRLWWEDYPRECGEIWERGRERNIRPHRHQDDMSPSPIRSVSLSPVRRSPIRTPEYSHRARSRELEIHITPEARSPRYARQGDTYPNAEIRRGRSSAGLASNRRRVTRTHGSVPPRRHRSLSVDHTRTYTVTPTTLLSRRDSRKRAAGVKEIYF
ncbi:hypothetical protein CC78DRAFT_571266 [Lojkania enalia]|uniref:Uncharacterized protein n=1 Tax=Lojkania enalia TaxID=147567 RepID=A0A9P4K1T3_9PLEO|nr:hypothetical protein CC78DRAFT_571266 [Didymosphaeria enalia]